MYCKTLGYLMIKWSDYMWLFIKYDLTMICTVLVLRHLGTSIPMYAIIFVLRFLMNKRFTKYISLAETEQDW